MNEEIDDIIFGRSDEDFDAAVPKQKVRLFTFMTIHGSNSVFCGKISIGLFFLKFFYFILQVLWNYVGTTYDQFMQGADSFEELETELAKQIRKCSNSFKNVCKWHHIDDGIIASGGHWNLAVYKFLTDQNRYRFGVFNGRSNYFENLILLDFIKNVFRYFWSKWSS